jgi:glucose-6-phosphate 1-dehydrogenase
MEKRNPGNAPAPVGQEPEFHMADEKPETLSIVIIGASGDLARRKIIPALFALYCQNLIPGPFRVFGFARTAMTHEAFRQMASEHLTCRYVPHSRCEDRMAEFLSRCYYQEGQYDLADSLLDLYRALRTEEGSVRAQRMFYLAVPPAVFLGVARAIGNAGLVECGGGEGWSRVVIEKPFGRDRATSDILVEEMGRVFREDQTYRIDHYLGKEIVQNLMVLRFANLFFEPVWNRMFIEQVSIAWSEEQGIGSRGGYFDGYGIIRDVMQNHLLQILALMAMEEPTHYDARAVCDEKVRLLRSIPPLTVDDVVIGQYRATERKGQVLPGYRQEVQVPPDSRTPTYAAVRLKINNRRWEGVPFLMTAGKALSHRTNEIRVRFRAVPRNIFCGPEGTCLEPNELVIRIQPDEGLVLRLMNKVPGLGMELAPTDLNLRYAAAFPVQIPDAYECLLLDVLKGDRSLFIRSDELAVAWDIFTPVLHALEERRVEPLPYAIGSEGPV